jgi:ankyrin repeat protein
MTLIRFIFCLVFLNTIYNVSAETPKNEIAERFVEYAHNKDNWPILHYAIEQERPDVAAEALYYFPDQAIIRTPDIKLMASYLGSNDRDDYDYQVGTEQGISAIELAVRKGYVDLTKSLLELGCSSSEVHTEYFGYIADYYSEKWRPFVNDRTIKERVKFVNPTQKNTNYWTRSILYWAIEANNEEMVKLLLEASPSLDGIKAQRSWRSDSNFAIERTSVHQAAYMASDEILQALISYQSNITMWQDQVLDPKILEIFRTYVNNDSDWPPLHSALKSGDHEAFNLLLEYKEDVKWQGRAPHSLLAMAIASDDYYFLDLMISYGINIDEAIKEAVNQNKIDHLKNLLPYMVPNEESAKILEHATQKKYTDIVVELINHGVRSGHAIELAIKTDNLDLTSYLIEQGGVNFAELGGLDTAIRGRMVSMIELLVQAQIQKNRDVQDSLLSLAIRSKDLKIFSLVEEAGYWDPDLWNAFVDANEVDMLHNYLQNEINAQKIVPQLKSMKKRAIEQGHSEILAYMMNL